MAAYTYQVTDVILMWRCTFSAPLDCELVRNTRESLKRARLRDGPGMCLSLSCAVTLNRREQRSAKRFTVSWSGN